MVLASFIVIPSFGEPFHFAQLGCELLSRIRVRRFTVFVGTSSKDNSLEWSSPRQNINARELGAQEGSSPGTSSMASPPAAGTMNSVNPRTCAVNAIHLPSGDQSGSVAPGANVVRNGTGEPPEAEAEIL